MAKNAMKNPKRIILQPGALRVSKVVKEVKIDKSHIFKEGNYYRTIDPFRSNVEDRIVIASHGLDSWNRLFYTGKAFCGHAGKNHYRHWHYLPCPYQVGSRYWVAEAWRADGRDNDKIYYKSDEFSPEFYAWQPPSKMKKKDSRRTVEVVSRGLQKVKEMTLNDLKEMGFYTPKMTPAFAVLLFQKWWNNRSEYMWDYKFKEV